MKIMKVITATSVCLNWIEFHGTTSSSETSRVKSHTLHVLLKFSDAFLFFPGLLSLNSGIFPCFVNFSILCFSLVSKENVWSVSQSVTASSVFAG